MTTRDSHSSSAGAAPVGARAPQLASAISRAARDIDFAVDVTEPRAVLLRRFEDILTAFAADLTKGDSDGIRSTRRGGHHAEDATPDTPTAPGISAAAESRSVFASAEPGLRATGDQQPTAPRTAPPLRSDTARDSGIDLVGARAPIEPLLDLVQRWRELIDEPGDSTVSFNELLTTCADELEALLRSGPAQKDAPEPETERC